MVNVFLGESPVPGPERWLGQLTRQLLGATFGRRLVERSASPGSSLDLLPDVPLPKDLGWAASSPSVGGAFARAAAVVEEVGRRALPQAVRELVSNRIAVWSGEAPGLTRARLEHDVASLDEADRPLATFALADRVGRCILLPLQQLLLPAPSPSLHRPRVLVEPTRSCSTV